MTSAEFGKRYQELKKQYLEKLPNRLKELNTLWNRLKHVSWDDKALSVMEQGSHKLSGSGSTFHFPDISEQAQGLEHQLQLLRGKQDVSLEERAKLEASLRSLEHAIHQAINSDTQEEPAPPAPASAKPHHRVAVIEDDLDQADLLRLWLEERGFEVDTFDTPAAFSQRPNDDHHLILMDISFSEGALEGIALLERLKHQVDANRPVLMMSARSDMVARMRALRAGADGYVTKPIDFGVLETQIDQLLGSDTNAKQRVLWVDDDTEQLAYYQALLVDRGYEVEALSKPLQILERIEQFQPDAIVMDHEMPGVRGMELARMLRQDSRFMTIPILFVSASAAMTKHRQTYGITDNEVFQKPLDSQRFLMALHRLISQAKLISSRIKQVSQRKEPKGLLNHDFFLAELTAKLAYLENSNEDGQHCLVQVGIDRAEYLKAQHGVRAMASLTARMEHHFSEQLSVGELGCHLGGGSFLFLLNVPEAEKPEAFLERFHRLLNRPTWTLGEPPHGVTISLGVLTLNRAMNEDQALLEIERACGEAMQAGGNRVIWCRSPERSEQSKLDDRIRERLEAKSFTLHYQPTVNLDSGNAFFEALVRLVDDNKAVYLPGQFMSVIEEGKHSSFRDLDRWVIEHAIDELSKLGGKASASHAVAIKLASPIADLAKMLPLVSTCMRNARLKGKRRVYLALSSRTVIKNVAGARHLLQVLGGMDCGLIIEHIEIGPASVELLKELPTVDFVKLAPKYGSSVEQTTELEDMLREVDGIFGSTQPIIATGVEDARALSWFWERNVRHFQGHFIQVPEVAMNSEL